MELYNNMLCISANEITDEPDPIMNYNTYKKYITRNTHIKARRGGGYGVNALLKWDILRNDLKKKYIDKYGDPEKKLTACLKNYIKKDLKAVDFFSNYILPDGRHLPANKQKEYSINIDILNTLIEISNDRKALQKALGGKTKIWNSIADELSYLKTELNHNLPLNPIRLKQKVEEYKKSNNDYTCVIPNKWMNKNAAAVKESEQEAAMRQLLRKHNNLDNEQICTLYNIISEKLNWKKITPATVGNYRERFNLTTYAARKGETAFDNNIGMQVKRYAPSYPLYYWTVDGWDVELLYQKTEIDKKGNSITTYHNRLTVVVVLDPCCKYPIGYAVAENESSDLIKKALRSSIIHTKEIFGEFYKVLQVQSDNYGKKALTPLYEVISEKYTPAKVGNAKAKVIEPYFRKINHDYCQLMPNWSGYGVKSKKQPNSEYLNKIKHSFPDKDGVIKQIEFIISQERVKTKEKYLELFSQMPETDKKKISYEDILFNFGEKTGYINTLTGPGVIATIDGKEYCYDTFDKAFRRTNEKWSLRYLPENPDKVLAINATGINGKLTEEIGTLRFILENKYVQPMALRERNDVDSVELKRISSFNKELKQDILSEMQEDYIAVNELMNRQELEGTLTKLILGDSTGSHKDNKSAIRLKNTAKSLNKKQQLKLQKNEEQSWLKKQQEYLQDKVDIEKYLTIEN